MRNQTWLPGTCDLRGSEVKVQAARDHLPSLSLSSQSSHWVKLLDAEGLWRCLQGLLTCCQDGAAEENKRVFSNGGQRTAARSSRNQRFLQVDDGSPPPTTQSSSLASEEPSVDRFPLRQKQLFHKSVFTRTAFIQVPSGAWPADLPFTTSRRTAGAGDEWELRKGGE